MSQFTNKVNYYLEKMKSSDIYFEKLYNLCYEHLLVIAKLYLSDKSYAEDIVCDTFISVFNNIQSFDYNKNGYNWLCKIVQNKAFNFNLKSKKVEFSSEIELLGGEDFTDYINLKSDVAVVLKRLSERERQIIKLRFFEDKTYEEIAKIFSQSTTATHKQVRKILKKVENLLKGSV